MNSSPYETHFVFFGFDMILIKKKKKKKKSKRQINFVNDNNCETMLSIS